MRKFDIANRDRFKAEAFLDFPFDSYVTVTPTAGFRDDTYPDDTVNQLGLKRDTGWNVGIDAAARIGQDLKATAGYNYEIRSRNMVDCCGGAPGGVTTANIWGSDIHQRYHTLSASVDWKAIPNKLDFRLLYLLALGRSEERRVGKECRSRWSPAHSKKKKREDIGNMSINRTDATMHG